MFWQRCQSARLGATRGPTLRQKTEKPLRRPIYLGNQARANRLEEIRRERGLCSDSEVVRRLIDDAPRKRAPTVAPIGEVRLPRRGLDLAELTERIERVLIEQALDKAKGNVTLAAALLGMSRRSLQKRLRRLQVRPRGALTAPEGRAA